ncbi:hypothetical protein J2X87_004850, partial [Pseudomonas synxantha]|nr:hypothetical protein [Pseudomonas synxantha]
MLAKAACQPTCVLLTVYISIAAVTAAYGFALTASPFGKRPKGTKGLAPYVRP